MWTPAPVLIGLILVLSAQNLANGQQNETLDTNVYIVPTCSQIQHMKDAINLVFQAGSAERFQSKAVRLGFHGCVGGCDGCINLELEDNQQLVSTVAALEEAYQYYQAIPGLSMPGFSHFVSRADFWALAAMVGLEHGTKNQSVCFDYTWGRPQNCPMGPMANIMDPFPKKYMNGSTITGMFEYFHKNFGLMLVETTALLGVHSLRAFGPESFGNIYYQSMLDPNFVWEQAQGMVINNVTHKCEWLGYPKTGQLPNNQKQVLMFNSDMELIFDTHLDINGVSNCDLDVDCGSTGTCGLNDTCTLQKAFYYAKAYSQDEDLFFIDFKKAFNHVLSNGVNTTLVTMGGTCNPTCQ